MSYECNLMFDSFNLLETVRSEVCVLRKKKTMKSLISSIEDGESNKRKAKFQKQLAYHLNILRFVFVLQHRRLIVID